MRSADCGIRNKNKNLSRRVRRGRGGKTVNLLLYGINEKIILLGLSGLGKFFWPAYWESRCVGELLLIFQLSGYTKVNENFLLFLDNIRSVEGVLGVRFSSSYRHYFSNSTFGYSTAAVFSPVFKNQFYGL